VQRETWKTVKRVVAKTAAESLEATWVGGVVLMTSHAPEYQKNNIHAVSIKKRGCC